MTSHSSRITRSGKTVNLVSGAADAEALGQQTRLLFLGGKVQQNSSVALADTRHPNHAAAVEFFIHLAINHDVLPERQRYVLVSCAELPAFCTVRLACYFLLN